MEHPKRKSPGSPNKRARTSKEKQDANASSDVVMQDAPKYLKTKTQSMCVVVFGCTHRFHHVPQLARVGCTVGYFVGISPGLEFLAEEEIREKLHPTALVSLFNNEAAVAVEMGRV